MREQGILAYGCSPNMESHSGSPEVNRIEVRLSRVCDRIVRSVRCCHIAFYEDWCGYEHATRMPGDPDLTVYSSSASLANSLAASRKNGR